MFGCIPITENGSHGQRGAGKLMLHCVGAFGLKSVWALLLQGKQQSHCGSKYESFLQIKEVFVEGPGMVAEEWLEPVKFHFSQGRED